MQALERECPQGEKCSLYSKGGPTGGDGSAWGTIWPILLVGSLSYCMWRYYRRAQDARARGGEGGWGGRGDPETEGIGLLGTCLPTGSRRARNFVNDMQERRQQGTTRLAARDGAQDEDDML